MPKDGLYTKEELRLKQGYMDSCDTVASNGARAEIKIWSTVHAMLPLTEGQPISFVPKALSRRADRGGRCFELAPTFPVDEFQVKNLKLWGTDEGAAHMLTGLVRALQPAVVLEIGTNWGRGTRALAEGISYYKKGHLWTVDMIDYEIHSSGALLEEQKEYVTQVVGKTPNVYFDDTSMIDMKGIDFAFLDGEHTAKGIEEDLAYVESHRSTECLVVVDNARDSQWPESAELFESYSKYPHINLPTMCGMELIWMADSDIQKRKGA
jgi:predicted O-methyltransferase YrrM